MTERRPALSLSKCQKTGVRIWLVEQDGEEVWVESGGMLHACDCKAKPHKEDERPP